MPRVSIRHRYKGQLTEPGAGCFLSREVGRLRRSDDQTHILTLSDESSLVLTAPFSPGPEIDLSFFSVGPPDAIVTTLCRIGCVVDCLQSLELRGNGRCRVDSIWTGGDS